MTATYDARALIALPFEQLWQLPEERHQVVFDDGVVNTHTRVTILSIHLMHLLVPYPEVPVKCHYHLGERQWNSKVMLEVLNDIRQDIDDFYHGDLDREQLRRDIFQVVNAFYNQHIMALASYVMGLDMFDLLDIMECDSIVDALNHVKPTQHAIEEVVYPKIEKALLEDEQLSQNPLAIAARNGTLKMGQLLQCIGPRGYLTDINSELFPEPITQGYIQGIHDLYGSMIESRTASKSLLFNKLLLRDTEYFSRKVQLVSQYLQTVHKGDCGSMRTMPFNIASAKWLKQLRGKWYYLPARELSAHGNERAYEHHRSTDTCYEIKGNETELIGKTVYLRSVLTCEHPDPSGVCEACYGRLYESIPDGTNAGQVSAVSACDKITSAVLETKHLDSTSRVESFHLQRIEARYLTKGKRDESLYLKPNLGKKIILTVMAKEVSSLSDAIIANELSQLSVSSTTDLTQVRIQVDDYPSDILTVSLFNRKASFTIELLRYIRKHKWSHDATGNYVIDISDFGTTMPLLELPFKHVNMFENMRYIQAFLHSAGDNEKRLARKDERMRNKEQYQRKLIHSASPEQALFDFAVMLNEKLSINVVHCEVLLYVMMVRNLDGRDYRLPKPGVSGEFARYDAIMRNRSLGAIMALEGQAKVLASPAIFVNTDTNDHPYDVICMGGNMTDN